MITICVWQNSKGWFWDDAEDHGGYDRISPMGPFESRGAASDNAREIFSTIEVIDGYPDHYPSAESV